MTLTSADADNITGLNVYIVCKYVDVVPLLYLVLLID